VVAPDDSVLFVANANSELRYDSGSISVIDLNVVETVIQAWTSSIKDAGNCTPDIDHPETLICNAKPFMKRTSQDRPAAVRIGNFSTDIALQDFTPKPAGTPVHFRLFVPTRGDPSVAWADYDGDRLSCTSGSESFGLCDDAHRLQTPDNDLASSVIPDEPFNVFADSANGFAIVTHLTNGAVTLIDSKADGDAQIADVRLDVFAPSPGTGLRSATGVAGRTLGPGTDDIIYVGSRSDDRIQTFTVGHPRNDAPPYLVPGSYFFLDSVGTNTGAGNSADTRGIRFSPPHDPSDMRPDLLYVVNRSPPSVQIFDTSIGPDGLPLNRPTGASDICPEASTLTVLDARIRDTSSGRETSIGERAYITCFQDGTVYVVDPRGQSQVEDIISVGRGPFAIAASQTMQQLFISNFLEDTIAVVDVNPASPTKNRVVLRIGIPRAP
jgi:DNA-binding beta-propeller fold protein YncE